MAPRRQSHPPPPEIKQFTTDEIEQGIRKLRRRIEEVNALDPQRVRYDDQAILDAEQVIRNAILEIFGLNSSEYLADHYGLLCHVTGSWNARGASQDVHRVVAVGIAHTANVLEG